MREDSQEKPFRTVECAQGPPLLLGVPDAFWADRLAADLEETAQCRLIRSSAGSLAEAVSSGDVDCAGLAPLDAVGLTRSRAVPGWGVSLAGMATEVDSTHGAHRLKAPSLVRLAEAEGWIPPPSTSVQTWAWWRSRTDLPLVLMLWVGRSRAPYSALRHVLTVAMRRSVDYPHTPVGSGLRISLTMGGAEMEGLRALIARGVSVGLCPEGAGITFC